MNKEINLTIRKYDKQFVWFNSSLCFDIQNGVLTNTPNNISKGVNWSSLDCQFPYRECIPQLELPLTDRCNMACEYCSFRSRSGQGNRPSDMNMDVADDAIKFYKKYIVENGNDYIRIDFGVTGEPFLRLADHPILYEKIKKIFQNVSVQAIYAGPYVTNALLAEKAEIHKKMGPPQDISCDGPESVHDAVRHFPNGKGTYKALAKVINSILKENPDIGVSAVLTANYTEFDLIFIHLYKTLGFRSIFMKPVNLNHQNPLSLNSKTVEAFKAGYTKLIDMILCQDKETMLSYLLALNEEDFFMRYFYRVKDRSRQIYRCGSGKSGVYTDSLGNLYPCAHFIGMDKYIIGTIYDGIKESWRQKFNQLSVDNKKPCSDCWARYLCGGGCYYQAELANGTISIPDNAKCELTKHLCLEAMRLYVFLSSYAPDVLCALPDTYFVNENNLYHDYKSLYMPEAKLIQSSEYTLFQLTQQGRIKQILKCHAPEINISFRKDGDLFTIELSKSPKVKIAATISIVNLDVTPIYMSDLFHFRYETKQQKIRMDFDQKVLEQKKCSERLHTVPISKPEWLETEKAYLDKEKDCAICLDFSKVFEGGSIPSKIGLNVRIDFQNGGYVLLVRHEPFCVINSLYQGYLMPSDGEFLPQSTSKDQGDILYETIEHMLPIGRWMGVKTNVC